MFVCIYRSRVPSLPGGSACPTRFACSSRATVSARGINQAHTCSIQAHTCPHSGTFMYPLCLPIPSQLS